MAVTLTDAQRAQLDEQGFTLLENVFTRQEMDELAEHIEAFQRQHEEAIRASGGTEGISRADEITFTAFLAENDDYIKAFCQRPEFVSLTTQLLGPDVDLYWNQAVFKHPEGEKQFPWHQDDGYTPVDPSPYLTLWLALNDATLENGCIWALPGSHKKGLLPHESTPIGLACHSLDDPDQGVPVPVSAGSIAVFWSRTVHKSGVNTSRGPRKAYIIQYSHYPLTNLRTGELVPNRIAIARGGSGVGN